MTKDYAANLAIFLQAHTGSIFGNWQGRLSAKEQRALFGLFLGKGLLYIDGKEEVIEHHIKTCFGLDSERTALVTWRDL